MINLNHPSGHAFTRLYAQVTEENGGFTVSVRMFNHENQIDNAQGHQLARSIEMASEMISDLATQFSIPQSCISIRFAMANFKDGTLH
jgi:hemoglobin-like flavoprotein